ncbi:MAG: DUF357 domain-containing protein [Candidatus Woesearchaeota archaeon]
MDKVSKEKLDKYFSVTRNALDEARESPENVEINDSTRKHFIDTVERYLKDAKHFEEKGDLVNAFAALNYAHGWLDAGAKLGVFDVNNPKLFAGVD